MFGLSTLTTSLIGGAVLFLLGTVGGGIAMHKVDQGSYQTLETKFADYQGLVAKAEAATRSNDLADAQRLAKAQQDALAAANARAAAAELARAQAAQNLHDLLTKEGKSDVALGLCLARPLPADVLRQLAH